jgi:uncharacterized protein
MLHVGQFNKLIVLEIGTHGAILDGGQWGRLLLPILQCPAGTAPGDELDVFVYLDAEGDPVPTTVHPKAQLGQVALLEVVEVNNLGAFVDWGLPKDLFIPYAEQHHKLSKGRETLVKVYLDNQGRLTGTTRIDHWIKDEPEGLKLGQKVSLVIADKTELGLKAIINHQCWGLLYGNEMYRKVRKGQVVDGYVKRIREDGKVDLSLDKPGFSQEKMEGISGAILTALQDNDGFLALNDKSPPKEIYAAFGVSKKIFKQGVGALYKQRRITIEKDGIHLA